VVDNEVSAPESYANATDTERALWLALRNDQLGWRFRQQFVLALSWPAPEARLIVEADGGQHAEPGADSRRDKLMTEKGWRLLRLWDNSILDNSDL
jgi:very-short-patch-repair endonuclease